MLRAAAPKNNILADIIKFYTKWCVPQVKFLAVRTENIVSSSDKLSFFGMRAYKALIRTPGTFNNLMIQTCV